LEVLLIYNPISGNANFTNNLDLIIDRFQQNGHQIIPYRTGDTSFIDSMISAIDINRIKRIIVAGGDGTVNMVVNSMQKHNIDIPIAIFPVGTANDYAGHFNISNNLDAMINTALGDNYILSDIGMMNDKYFINVASLGFLVDVSQKTETKLKNSLGTLAYYIKGLEELPNFKPLEIKISDKNGTIEEKIFFMLIMNGTSAGGFKKLAPFASTKDGLLEVILFKECPIYEMLSLLIKVSNGEHINSPYVTYFQSDELTIECNSDVGVDIDGEKGSEFPLHIRLIPQKLKIVADINLK